MKFKSLLFVLLATTVLLANADTFPQHTVKIVTNLPVGSSPDGITRKVADVLSAKWHVPVVVENRPGANGVVGLEAYLKEPADGYAIYMGDFGSFVTMPTLYNKDKLVSRVRTLVPMYQNYWVIVTPKSIKNLDELKAAAKIKPYYGSWGVGTSGNICGAELSQEFKIDGVHAPYKEYGQWFSDVINGNLTFSCASVGATEQYREAGKLNYIAITADTRDPELPGVPTIKELTGKPFDAKEGWIGFFINRDVPEKYITQLEADLRSAVADKETQESIAIVRGKPWSASKEEFEHSRVTSYNKYKKLINELHITVE